MTYAPVTPMAERVSDVELPSDKTRWALTKAKQVLELGVNIQALGQSTNETITGIISSLVAHCDELEADLNVAIAVGRLAANESKDARATIARLEQERDAATAAERERCAALADGHAAQAEGGEYWIAASIADAIRKGDA